MRRNSTITLGDAIKEFLAEYKHASKLKDAEVVCAWPEVMGKNIAAYTSNVYFKNGKLFVELKSSVLRSELMMHRGKIMKTLNSYLGESVVKELILR